jgi:hypothetical protein
VSERERLRPMAEAAKDQTPVLAKFRPDIRERFYCGQRDDLRRWEGIWCVVHHPGLPESGRDFGWNVAAPIRHGGFPDEWFEGWLPLPDARSLRSQDKGGEDGR